MGKKRKFQHHGQRPSRPSSGQANKGKAKEVKGSPSSKAPKSKNQPQQNVEPIIPFSAEDSILLVGDGDLSFAASLIEHHGCGDNLTATVLEANLGELTEKYPYVGENIEKIEAEGGKVTYGVDARKMGPWAQKKGKESIGRMDRISELFSSDSLVRVEGLNLMIDNSFQLSSRWRQEYRRESSGPV